MEKKSETGRGGGSSGGAVQGHSSQNAVEVITKPLSVAGVGEGGGNASHGMQCGSCSVRTAAAAAADTMSPLRPPLRPGQNAITPPYQLSFALLHLSRERLLVADD